MSFEESLKETSLKLEKAIDTYGEPIKPYLPSISRFLVVATFYEDSVRILLQWSDQRHFLERARGFPVFFSFLFLIFNVLAMLTFSSTLIAKKHVSLSVSVLSTVIVTQALGYGLVFDMVFFLRNLSILGGLLLCLSEHLLKNKKRSNTSYLFGSMTETERHEYFQLAGRILLVLLFFGFVLQGEWSVLRVLVSLVGLAASVMVAVGFRARWSASLLVTLLCIMNMVVNNWWSLHHSKYERDVTKYNFFQCLSIVGGLLLLINIGPGHLSYDEKKKEY